MLWEKLALQLLHQIVVNGTSHQFWRCIPGLSLTRLPNIGIEPGEVGTERVQIGRNGLGTESYTCLFGKQGQGEMQTILGVKDSERVLVPDTFWSSRKPIRDHVPT